MKKRIQRVHRAVKNPLWLTITFLVVSIISQAQDLKQSLLQMRQMYNSMSGLHIEMSVEVMEAPNSTDPIFTLPVDIKKKEQNYLYHYGTNRMLMNNRYFIMVDESSKEMVYGNRVQVEENSIPGYLNFNMDSILMFYDEPEYLGNEKGIHKYGIVQQMGPVRQVYLWIDERTQLLRRMDYEYREGSYVKIHFTKFDGDPSFQPDTFSEAQFIRMKGTEMVTSAAYRQYHLVESVVH